MSTETDNTIHVHGAPAVYRAASRWMAGYTSELQELGVACDSMSAAWRIMDIAHDQMDDADRAIDQAQATSELDRHRNN